MVEGLSTYRTGGALAFGSLVHEVLDVIYSRVRDTGLRQPEFTYLLEDMLNHTMATLYVRDRQELENSGTATADDIDALTENHLVAKPVLLEYFNYWHGDMLPDGIQWRSLEEIFDVYYDPYKRLGMDLQPIRIRGKFDGVFDLSGYPWLFETKTKGRVDEEGIMDRLGHEIQVMLYMWAFRQMRGEFMHGVYYNIIRRPQLKRRTSETLIEFASRVHMDILERKEFYYKRYVASISEKEQIEWEDHLDGMMRHLIYWCQGRYHFRNSSACMGGPGNCKFLGLCSGRDTPDKFMTRTQVFPELVGLDGE